MPRAAAVLDRAETRPPRSAPHRRHRVLCCAMTKHHPRQVASPLVQIKRWDPVSRGRRHPGRAAGGSVARLAQTGASYQIRPHVDATLPADGRCTGTRPGGAGASEAPRMPSAAAAAFSGRRWSPDAVKQPFEPAESWPAHAQLASRRLVAVKSNERSSSSPSSVTSRLQCRPSSRTRRSGPGRVVVGRVPDLLDICLTSPRCG